MNLLSNVFYFVILLAIMFTSDISLADKHNKKGDKHKNSTQNKPNQHETHKNSTVSHDNKNHTLINANHTVPNQNSMFIQNEQQSAHPHNPSNTGWSLNQNQAPQHQNNPNGYVMQSHDNSHGTSQLHQQNANIQPQQHQQPQQGSSNYGGVALGAVGGLASGAVGGYLLSNALNSGSKSGEKEIEQPLVQAVNETTASINETTILEITTPALENNTLSSTVEIRENLNHTDSTSTVAQTTQKPPEPNKAASTIQLSTHICAFLLLFIKILL